MDRKSKAPRLLQTAQRLALIHISLKVSNTKLERGSLHQ